MKSQGQRAAFQKLTKLIWDRTAKDYSKLGLPEWDSLSPIQRNQIAAYSYSLRRKLRMEMILAYYKKKKEESEQIQRT
jgi:hypothetical protein